MISIKNALRELLDKFDEIDKKFPCAFGDTAVREAMSLTIQDGFLDYSDRYYDIDKYLAYSPDWEGDKPYYDHLNEACDLATHEAFKTFFNHPEVLAVDKENTTRQMRLDAFQDHTATSKEGNEYDYYFGWIESLE